MSVTEPNALGGAGLIDRVKNILMTPTKTWQEIDAEPADTGKIFTAYVMPLAAIGPVASFLGGQVFGYGAFGISIKPSLMSGAVGALTGYILALAGVFVMGFIINILAPTFEGQKNDGKALQVAAYSATAGYLVGVFQLMPALGVLGLLGLYGIFLLYKGLPILMKASEAKAVAYTISVIVVGIVLGIIAVTLSGCVNAMTGFHNIGAAYRGAHSGEGGEVSIGGAKIDLGKMEQAAKQMEQAAKQMEAAGMAGAAGAPGAAPALDIEKLKALLPASLPGGYARTEVSTGSSGAFGMGVSGATGKYQAGDKTISLTVGDMNAMGALAGVMGAMGVQQTTETADGYEKMHTINGAPVMEQLSRAAKTASYATIVNSRFLVSAEGTNVGAEDVKAAIAQISPGQLQALAAAAP